MAFSLPCYLFAFKSTTTVALGNNLKKPVVKPAEPVALPEPVLVQAEVPVADWYHDDEEEDEQVEATSLFCVFRSGREEYAVPIALAKEVVKTGAIAPVPQTPSYITGMTNVRGNIYAVVDLEAYFGAKSETARPPFLLVLNHEEVKVALSIPDVPDTLAVPESAIETITSSMLKTVKKREFLKGLVKKDHRMIILLNILEMISDPAFAHGHADK